VVGGCQCTQNSRQAIALLFFAGDVAYLTIAFLASQRWGIPELTLGEICPIRAIGAILSSNGELMNQASPLLKHGECQSTFLGNSHLTVISMLQPPLALAMYGTPASLLMLTPNFRVTSLTSAIATFLKAFRV